jgi:hypothetical protein
VIDLPARAESNPKMEGPTPRCPVSPIVLACIMVVAAPAVGVSQNPPFVTHLGGGSFANPGLLFSNTPGAITVQFATPPVWPFTLPGSYGQQRFVWLMFGNPMPPIALGTPACATIHAPFDYAVGPFYVFGAGIFGAPTINYAASVSGYSIHAQLVVIDVNVQCTCWCQHGGLVCSQSVTTLGGPWSGACSVLPGVHLGFSDGYLLLLP